MNHHIFMQLAIEKALEGIKKGQTPFGTCIVKEGKPISIAHNHVWAHTDITAHAEIEALRLACQNLNTIDLTGCSLYSTCEPCPMCFCAIHWANIKEIYFGAKLEKAKEVGFHELPISNAEMKRQGKSSMNITGNVMTEACNQLFETWLQRPDKKIY